MPELIIDAEGRVRASMKVPPKRKGNFVVIGLSHLMHSASMKAPPKRKGNRSFRLRS
mgnify:CR=1 FL=1